MQSVLKQVLRTDYETTCHPFERSMSNAHNYSESLYPRYKKRPLQHDSFKGFTSANKLTPYKLRKATGRMGFQIASDLVRKDQEEGKLIRESTGKRNATKYEPNHTL